MPSIDLLTGYWPGWLSLVVAFILVVNKLAEESEKFANRLGSIGRRIRKKSLERHHIDLKAAEFAQAVRVEVGKAVDEARQKWEEDENEAIAALDARLTTVSAVTAQQIIDIEGLNYQLRCAMAYTEYEATWHNRLSIQVANSGGKICLDDLPLHFGYFEFEKTYKADTNWRKWGFDAT